MSEAKFAPVAPLDTLIELHRQGVKLDYLLLLAHDVAERSADWRDACREYFAESFIVMDNSLIELGHPCSKATMEVACNATNPNVVVLPDKLKDASATLSMSAHAIDDWAGVVGNAEFMGVAQGDTKEEVLATVSELKYLPRVGYISIPRVVAQQFGTRSWAIEYAATLCGGLTPRVHLLGFSDDVKDDLDCARMRGVMGIDSAVPIRSAMRGIYGEQMLWVDCGPRGDYWEQAKHAPAIHVAGNVSWVQEQLRA